MADPITGLAETMWVSWPLRVQRRYSSMRGVMGDWHGIALVPPLAVLSMFVVALSYFLVGAAGFGFDRVYSESLLLMASLVALGALSGQLGLLGLAAFAVGDFFVGNRTWTVPRGTESFVEELIRARLPLIISYLLLGVAVIVIPRLGKNIALGIGRWRRIPTDLAWLVTTPIVVIVSWLGLRTWAALAPTLIRPIFVWTGGVPTVEAIQVLQTQTSDLIVAGVGATVVRQTLVGLGIYLPALKNRIDALEARAHLKIMAGGDPTPPRQPSVTSRFMADATSALVASLVLAGILETRLLWTIVFVAFLTIRFLRSGTIRFDLLERWKVQAKRVPVAVRLGLAWLAAILYRSFLSDDAIGSYRGMAIIVLVGVVAAFLVFPGRPRPSDTTESEPGPGGEPADPATPPVGPQGAAA